MPLKTTVHIRTRCIRNQTLLETSYFETPFKVMNVTEDPAAGLELMLMSNSPGLLDGDEVKMLVQLGEKSNLHLRTQAYQRIFNMQHGAVQQLRIELESDSSLCYLPHPLVPQQDASVGIHNEIYLHETSCLIYGEVITCGRIHSGEKFLFKRLHSRTNVYVGKKLVVCENLLLQPGSGSFEQVGMMEGYTHQASLILYNCGMSTDDVAGLFAPSDQLAFGVTEILPQLVMVRMLGFGAEVLYNNLQQIKLTIINKRNSLTATA